MSTNNPEIIDVLINEHVIDAQKVQLAQNESLIKGISVEQVLLQKEWITPKDIVQAKSTIYGISFIDIATTPISKELISVISEEEATRLKIIIFDKQDDLFKAAMSNPLDIQTIRYFEQKLKGKIIVFIALEEDLLLRIKSTYSKNISSEFSSVVEQAASSSDFLDISDVADQSLTSLDVNNAPIAKIVNMILETAVKDKASDIHIEPQDNLIRVRFRIHGILREIITLPIEFGPSLASRIKILGKMAIDEKRKPLDGRFQVKAEGQEIDLRVSSLPTVLGEKIVIRLLRKDLGITNLEDTGMRGHALKTFMEGLKSTSGIILVTGPTGSGKTVTVATCMNILNKPEVNVVSIEDPVEIKIPGVNQVQVNNDAGLTFASALRSFLRQDPNIISVGEIRDGETAQLAAQASLTGHLVISTLHTNSASGVLPRLLDMGIEPYIIASTVHVCTAQRLCRKICRHCIHAYIPDEAELLEIRRVLSEYNNFNIEKYSQYQQNLIKQNNIPLLQKEIPPTNIVDPLAINHQPSIPLQNNQYQLYLFKGTGCDRCDNSGYAGRIGIFEVFKVTEKIGSLVMQHSSSEEIEREAVAGGMIKMIQDGYFKCIDGVTTIEEVQRVIHA